MTELAGFMGSVSAATVVITPPSPPVDTIVMLPLLIQRTRQFSPVILWSQRSSVMFASALSSTTVSVTVMSPSSSIVAPPASTAASMAPASVAYFCAPICAAQAALFSVTTTLGFFPPSLSYAYSPLQPASMFSNGVVDMLLLIETSFAGMSPSGVSVNWRLPTMPPAKVLPEILSA